MIHERHGEPRRSGSGTRFACQMQSLSKTTWNHHERRQNNSVENAFQRFVLSFVSFLRRKHDFWWRISTFVWRILFVESRIWTSGFNLRTRVMKSVTAAQERLDMRSGCHAAKVLPVGVRGTKNVWCLSSLFSRRSRAVTAKKWTENRDARAKLFFRQESKPIAILPFSLTSPSSLLKGDVKRNDSQRRVLAQHSVAML